MALSSEVQKHELDKLRTGFDLVLDIDCKILEWSKVCAKLLVRALEWHGIRSTSVKFSGGTGFHVAVPWESFPTDERIAFPDTPRVIAAYLKEFIRNQLADGILQKENDVKNISEKAKKQAVVKDGVFDPYSVLDIDTVLIASRHLLRMPYSLNEKKWLVSLPINAEDIDNFSVDWAIPANVKKFDVHFLPPGSGERGEAMQLMTQAFDWKTRNDEHLEEASKTHAKVVYENKVPVEQFPPCMKLILQGLADGRKRSLFALINFLKNAKWVWPEIETFIYGWNEKNKPPLKTGYVKSQLSWHGRQTRALPPPNCKSFYENIGVCKPDFICSRIRNPLTYPRHKTQKTRDGVKSQ